jgi:histidyl-tRNA synthetase
VSQTAEQQIARGMRDVLPDEMDRIRAVESAFAATCRAWGYREVRTPVIEPLHLFTAAGTLSPQTLDRIYSFLDWDGWSGERVVLRPDSTIPAARLYAERLDGGRTAKLFYNQNVFRFTDDGSSREEWQCGVELIGDTGLAGDVELVMLALDALRALGVDAPKVRLSHAGIVRAVLAAAGLSPDEQTAAYNRLLDGDLAVVDDIEARLPQLNAPLRLLFDVEGAGSGYIANIRSALAEAVPGLAAPLDDLAFVIATLEAAGVQPVIQAVLMRSFEYYSGVVMKIDGPDGKRLCTGGRYDALIGQVSGKSVPASGFAFYASALAELASPAAQGGAASVTVTAEANTPAALAAAHETAQALRSAGATVSTTADERTASGYVVACRAASPRFELSREGAPRRTFDALIDLQAALGLRS